MAQVTGSFDTYEAVGNREELAEAIYMITPEDTPLMTLLGREPVKTTHPEWQIDALATPGMNAVVEGDTWAFSEFTPTDRVGNYTQISDKKIAVTRTQEKTLKAGRKSELKRELKKKGAELKRDMEYALLQNNASVAGAAATPRELAGFAAWLETNTARGAGGADGGFNSSTGLVDAATNGTQRAFAKTDLDDVLEKAKASGGKPSVVMTSLYNKRVFSEFAGIAELRSNQNQGSKSQLTIFAGADTYVSDFGVLTIIPNLVMSTDAATARNVFVIDPDKAKVGIFDDITMHDVAKVGDAERRALTVEYTLIMRNEAAHGIVADTFGLTASS
ncbi:DUF5309 domain-containing protein [Falsochrobactrum ovis]|uniref:HK97 family phage major capsid protein n=1 Tax=Falsochrobactrum ovis TaxID=1293442 RepID=A0A364JVJ9_9HYPH|nr:DUF5309 domain-containing protein [Falsochrobactrum ovis]RAK29145.1 hypothetical protein C7374_105196 [Falsochrobactrum ovis]